MRAKTILLVLALTAIGASCASRRPEAAETPSDSKIRTFNGRGVVTKINPQLVSVELDHERIEGLMEAMRMEFYVKDKNELELLRIGDRVEFVLEDDAGAERIVRIAKAD